MERIYFHVPDISEFWYHQKMILDTHNINNNNSSDDFFYLNLDDRNLRMWYDKWVYAAPVNYYAYIVRASDNMFIGGVYLHKNHNVDMYDDYYDMGIFIENQYRSNGYGRESLSLLIDVAFCEIGASSVHNCFYNYQLDAMKIHSYVGFKITEENN